MSRYNRLKVKALAALSDGQWVLPQVWALRVKFWPLRSSYSYLARLWRFGLLDREDSWRVRYRLNQKGRERLAWLQRQARR